MNSCSWLQVKHFAKELPTGLIAILLKRSVLYETSQYSMPQSGCVVLMLLSNFSKVDKILLWIR